MKAKNGKCPKCHAPFEFGDSGWVCVAAGVFASNSTVPEGSLSSKSTIANLATLVDQNDYANDIATTTPPTSDPVITINIKDAIYKYKTLVEYDYYPTRIDLTPEEADEYRKLSARIAVAYANDDQKAVDTLIRLRNRLKQHAVTA